METLPIETLPQKNIFTIKLALTLVLFVVLVTISVLFYILSRKGPTQLTTIPEPKVLNYTKTQFNKVVPPSFLNTIPLAEGDSFKESYELTYASSSSQQATVVFSSPQTVLENYNLYKELLEKQGWWIPDYYKRAGKDFSSLYGNLYDEKTNLIYTINITIQKGEQTETSTSTLPSASEVSVSVLTKMNAASQ